ncbi:uncharacterized protein LOC133303448 [Gastrolobium bilobum]|uniref:uncharacterized protein LOC133303448 n=1 Tax=Gastrolobium bilobum TaxID=150636 RepID=UPI002AB0346E|nr:uncharacterized protein LOC133303448 [Gastrolobium bilobum]
MFQTNKNNKMEDPGLQHSIKRLSDLSDGTVQQEFEAITTKGIRLLEARKGFLHCSFIVPNTVSDENGNWHVGAIATLIDIIGSLAIYSFFPRFSVSVDFCISFYSTAKIQEEVELEAKVVGKKERLTSVVVEVRKKENGEIIALGKQWMSATNIISTYSKASKL